MLVALMCGLLGAAPAHAGNAWRSASWGMSEAEVLAAFPGEAQRLDGHDTYGAKPLRATVGIERLELAGSPFRVRFAFDDGKLALVNLSGVGDANSASTFDWLRKTLAEKYGPPVSDSRQGASLGASWRTGATVIRLTFIRLPGMRDVVLTYSPAQSAESDKL